MIIRKREVPGFMRVFQEVEFATAHKGSTTIDTRPGSFIMSVIILNCIALFLHSFNKYHNQFLTLEWVDHICTLLFVVELMVNVYERGWGYLRNPWHLFDAFIVFVSVITLVVFVLHLNDLIPDLEYLLVARILRVFKFYRLFEGSVNMREMFIALGKGMKASLYVVVAFLIYNFVVSLISFYLFHNIAPTYYENGFLSFYSTFKAFTGGAFEIADSITSESPVNLFLIKFYFIMVVISGGIIGLSLINTIFINEVTREQSDETHAELHTVHKELAEIKAMLKEIKEKK